MSVIAEKKPENNFNQNESMLEDVQHSCGTWNNRISSLFAGDRLCGGVTDNRYAYSRVATPVFPPFKGRRPIHTSQKL